MKRVNLEVRGMSCFHCVASVRDALARVPGVAVDDVQIGSARLTVDDTADLGAVIDAVSDAGYEAEEFPA